MVRALRGAAAAALLPLVACRHGPRGVEDVPAVIVRPTPESRAALARAVSTALHGAKVTLADDALTAASTLVIERAPQRDPRGLPANGRELGLPERFRLVKSGADCVLVHDRSGARLKLDATECSERRD